MVEKQQEIMQWFPPTTQKVGEIKFINFSIHISLVLFV